MDTSYLAQQVTTIIGQLHTLFDEIGVPHQERDARESELFTALSEALHGHLRQVSTEKNALIDEGQKIITTIRQMEASLEDPQSSNRRSPSDPEDLHVTYPLLECIEMLRERQRTVGRLHEERYEQVKKLVQALQSYSAHLEPSFVQLKLPPIAQHAEVPPNFDLSPSYIARVDTEFSRVYEEYQKRILLVQQLGGEVVNFWAELGIPQAQTDDAIVKHWRESPEQLGLHQSDIDRLKAKSDALKQEKVAREKKLQRLKAEVESLWDRLAVEDRDRKAFINANRGCGLRAINDFEGELSRLNELKRQNLHLFVEDARNKLNALWDDLYISEEEAVEFTPFFCDVYSDALLSAHETEISRLESLKSQRQPILALVAKHRSIIQDRTDLAASSNDASRLIAKKGERRDPTRLLREEKMRKRIARELPKVEKDLAKVLQSFEDEYGRPFLVFGERYLDELDHLEVNAAPPRSKTPNNFAASTATRKAANPPPPSRPATAAAHRNEKSEREASSTLRSKPTPIARPQTSHSSHPPTLTSSSKPPKSAGSPSRIPARIPLSSRADAGNSPERRGAPAASKGLPKQSQLQDGNATVRGHSSQSHMAPPPKMRPLGHGTPVSHPQPSNDVLRSGSVVRSIVPEDPYSNSHPRDAREMPPPPRPIYRSQPPSTNTSSHSLISQGSQSSVHPKHPTRERDHYSLASNHSTLSYIAPSSAIASSAYAGSSAHYPAYAISETASTLSASSRQISGSTATSHGSAVQNSVNGSENWETFGSDDDDETAPPPQAHAGYASAKHSSQNARTGSKRGLIDGPARDDRAYADGRFEGYQIAKGQGLVYGASMKKVRGEGHEVYRVVEDGRERVVSNGSNGWTDDGEILESY